MTKRGWTTGHLVLVAEDEKLWTVADASLFLGETQDEIRAVIRWRKIQPVGTRIRTGPEKRGRQPRVYRAIDLIREFHVIAKAA